MKETLTYGVKIVTDINGLNKYYDITNETYRTVNAEEARKINKRIEARVDKIREVNRKSHG